MSSLIYLKRLSVIILFVTNLDTVGAAQVGDLHGKDEQIPWKSAPLFHAGVKHAEYWGLSSKVPILVERVQDADRVAKKEAPSAVKEFGSGRFFAARCATEALELFLYFERRNQLMNVLRALTPEERVELECSHPTEEVVFLKRICLEQGIDADQSLTWAQRFDRKQSVQHRFHSKRFNAKIVHEELPKLIHRDQVREGIEKVWGAMPNGLFRIIAGYDDWLCRR